MTLVAALAVLLVVNLLNNRWAPALYVPTGIVGTLALVLLVFLDGGTWDDMGLGPGSAVAGLIWAAAAVLGVIVVYVVGLALPATRRGFDDARAAAGGPGRLAYKTLVHIPIGTVVLEEVAFRGALLALLVPRVGIIWGVAISSVLFGLWHVIPALGMLDSNAAAAAAVGTGRAGQVKAVVLTVLGTTIAGVGFCALLLVSGSLLAPMGLHWALNALGTILAWIRGRWETGLLRPRQN